MLVLARVQLADTILSARLRAETKPRIATLVESMYVFDKSQTRESISHNTKLAQTLLTNMNFVYPVRRTRSDPPCYLQDTDPSPLTGH